MAKKKNTTADSMRRLALLWGPQTETGRSGLSVRGIVSAAVEIADTGGLDTLSMRSVADRLGVGTMSLYTHIPGKDELIDLMQDSAYSELYQDVDEPSRHEDWRSGLRLVAQRNWDLFLKHPWLLQINPGRPVIGPHSSLKFEAELRPLEGLGLSDVEMDAALALVLTHVEGCARAMAAIQRTQRETGITDAEWWVTQAPLLDKIIDGTRFPVASRVGTAAGQAYQGAADPQFALNFGLERILVGIEELIRRKQG